MIFIILGYATKIEVMEMGEQEQQFQSKQLEQNKEEKPMSALTRAVLTGLIGGLLWSFIGAITYYISFSSVSAASFIVRSWLQTDWTGGFLAELIGIIGVGILSIGTALLFFGLLRKRKGLMPSILFGVALWGVIFYVLNPIFTAVPSVVDMDSNTIVTTLCLYILYGTFIGYSISYEYNEYEQRESRTKGGN
ncbi:YqhR family membrane protein [Pontibacillus salicampi]|uniref:YqhR family membrane protein n=1 Tax=Pontibacillus salicampi TaxID=1449801 RepID=A0ABV6LK02_9BACI